MLRTIVPHHPAGRRLSPALFPFALAAALLASCSSPGPTYGLDNARVSPAASSASRNGKTHMDRVSVECVPFDGTIEVDAGMEENSPVEIELEVNEQEQLLRSVKITANFTQALRNTERISAVTLRAGEVPPIKISFNKNMTTGTISVAQRPRMLN